MARLSTLFSPAAKRLEGKVALITGGASGIGEYTAKLFASHGAKVVVADIQDDLGHSLCKDLGPNSSLYIHCDVTKESDVRNAVDKTISHYTKLDVLYNNAGIVDIAKPNILDNDQADFERVLKTNILGPFLGIKHAARVMVPARSGSIISTASICSVMGGIATHAYTSSKHGVVGLTKGTAVELGRHGIRVNCVSPHVVATPLAKNFFNLDNEGVANVYSNLKGSSCKTEDVAEAALFFASDASKFVSGHNLVVDGGFTVMSPSFCMFE